MGAGASLTISPVKLGFSTMSITFQSTDRITVLHLDDPGLSTIRHAINETWTSGIQHEQARCGSGWSFKLAGSPFGYFNTTDSSVPARKMVCQILQRLYGIGWKLIGSGNIGRTDFQSTLFFKRFPPECSTRPFVCVSLRDTDKLQFINLPAEVMKPIKEAINCSWSLGIQKQDLVDGMLEVKLFGTPWRSSEKQSIMAKVLLQNIIATLRRSQWGYYGNVNCNVLDIHSLIFHYDPDITPGDSPPFCTISLKRSDRLRLIHAPQETIAMVRKVIETQWEPGHIQEERDYYESWEFKLSGNPWQSTKEESVRARYLLMKILEAMQEQGWHNIAGINCSQRFTDKTVMIFQKGQAKQSPMMCLSLNDEDKVRLINMSPQMVDLFKNTIILSRWSKGIQAEEQLTLNFGAVCQLKLLGCPWNGGYRDDTLHGQSLLCNILEEFWQRGWKPVLSADISSKYFNEDDKIPMDVYSMWFVYEPSLCAQLSAPTYDVSFANFTPQQYNIQPSPYLPSNQPPPSYFQATGWGEFTGEKS